MQKLEVRWWMHVLCWGIPVIATVIPLSNATYGAPGGLGWCWVVPTASTPKWAMKLWFWLSYYIWLWLTFAVIVVYFGLIALKLTSVRAETATQFRVIFYKMLGYPIIIFVSWFPSTCSDFGLYEHPGQVFAPWYNNLTAVTACLMGALSSILFWYTNLGLANEWLRLANAGFSLTQYHQLMSSGHYMSPGRSKNSNPQLGNASRRSLSKQSDNAANRRMSAAVAYKGNSRVAPES